MQDFNKEVKRIEATQHSFAQQLKNREREECVINKSGEDRSVAHSVDIQFVGKFQQRYHEEEKSLQGKIDEQEEILRNIIDFSSKIGVQDGEIRKEEIG